MKWITSKIRLNSGFNLVILLQRRNFEYKYEKTYLCINNYNSYLNISIVIFWTFQLSFHHFFDFCSFYLFSICSISSTLGGRCNMQLRRKGKHRRNCMMHEVQAVLWSQKCKIIWIPLFKFCRNGVITFDENVKHLSPKIFFS